MLAPREWRVETTEQFENDCDRLRLRASRFEERLQNWKDVLERWPFEYTHGLTGSSDRQRVLVSPEPLDALDYVAGVEIDRARRSVALQWLDTCPMG